jgi:uncharacterized protein (DUF952 family)
LGFVQSQREAGEKKDFMALVYKICPAADWERACLSGLYEGSAVDHRDGFIHLSTAAQVCETARRHFAGQEGLVLVVFDAAAIGDALVWEKSRDGDLFPHVYGTLVTAMAANVEPLPLGESGHIFPASIPK